MTLVGDWIVESCSTVGQGNLVLTGAAQSFSKFRDSITFGPVWYSIEDNGNRETGVGTFNGTSIITRDSIHATLVDGVYSGAGSQPISLSGNSIVSCTLSAEAYKQLIAHVDNVNNPHSVSAEQIPYDPTLNPITDKIILDEAINEISDVVNQNLIDVAGKADISSLGTAAYEDIQASLTDITTDRIMLTGAFGLGQTTSLPPYPHTSINDTTDVGSGIYRTVTGNTGIPSGTDDNSMVLLYFAQGPGIKRVQIAVDTTINKMYIRSCSEGTVGSPTWGLWTEVGATAGGGDYVLRTGDSMSGPLTLANTIANGLKGRNNSDSSNYDLIGLNSSDNVIIGSTSSNIVSVLTLSEFNAYVNGVVKAQLTETLFTVLVDTQVTGNITLSGFLNFNGASPRVSGNTSTSSLVLYGNSSTANGAAISLYGSSHATVPSAMIFYAANAERARFAPTTGNFLLGTTTDNSSDKFQISGDIGFTGDLTSTARLKGNRTTGAFVIHSDNGTTNGGTITLWPSGGTLSACIQFYAAGSERARFSPTNGNFLIGSTTDTGNAKFQLNGNMQFTQSTGNVNGLSTTAANYFNSADTQSGGGSVGVFGSAYATSSVQGAVAFYNNGSRTMTVVGGKVLVGTTTNNGLGNLQVDSSIAFQSTANLYGNAPSGRLAIYGNSTSSNGGSVILYGDSEATYPGWVRILSSTSNCAAFSQAGNTLLGTAADDGVHRLQVNGNASVSGRIRSLPGSYTSPSYSFQGDEDTGMYQYSDNTIGFACAATLLVTLDTNGLTSTVPFRSSVRGAVSAPVFSFSVDSNTGLYSPSADNLAVTTGSAQRCNFNSSGTQITGAITATGNITAYSSDERLKFIGDKLRNALSDLCSWRVVNYTWNEKGIKYGFAGSEFGFIAQDIGHTHHDAVALAPFDTDIEGNSKSGENYLTYRPEKVLAVAVAAIQELKAENDILRKRIEYLEEVMGV